jgi:hypothetical protein
MYLQYDTIEDPGEYYDAGADTDGEDDAQLYAHLDVSAYNDARSADASAAASSGSSGGDGGGARKRARNDGGGNDDEDAGGVDSSKQTLSSSSLLTRDFSDDVLAQRVALDDRHDATEEGDELSGLSFEERRKMHYRMKRGANLAPGSGDGGGGGGGAVKKKANPLAHGRALAAKDDDDDDDDDDGDNDKGGGS